MTLFTSVKKTWGTLSLIFLGVTFFTLVFGAIYEEFSHDVYSHYMIYAFVFPLALGVLPYLLRLIRNEKQYCRYSIFSWNAGIITLTVGSLFNGVLYIYGTTNKLVIIYPIVGVLLLLTAIVLRLIPRMVSTIDEA